MSSDPLARTTGIDKTMKYLRVHGGQLTIRFDDYEITLESDMANSKDHDPNYWESLMRAIAEEWDY